MLKLLSFLELNAHLQNLQKCNGTVLLRPHSRPKRPSAWRVSDRMESVLSPWTPWHWHWRNDVMKCRNLSLKLSEFWTLVKGGIGLIAMRLWEASSKLAAMPTSPQAPHLSPRCELVEWKQKNNELLHKKTWCKLFQQNLQQKLRNDLFRKNVWMFLFFRSIQYLSLRLRCHAWFPKPWTLRLGATLKEKSASTLSIGRIAMSGKCIQPRVGSWIIQLAHVAIHLGEMQSHNLTHVAGPSGNFYEDSECWTAVEEKSQRNFNFGFGFFSNLTVTGMLKKLKSCWFSLSSQRCMQKSCSSAFGFKDPIELLPCLVDKHSILQFVWGIFSAIRSDVSPCSIANSLCEVFQRMSCKIPAEWMNPATSDSSRKSNFLVFLSHHNKMFKYEEV